MKQGTIYLCADNLSAQIHYTEAQSTLDSVLGMHTSIKHLFPDSGKMILKDFISALASLNLP